METGKGLTGPDSELTWWSSVKGSPWLQDETVGLFLRLPGREARRDLLCVASEGPDGTHSLDVEDAQVLADALVALLSPGALLFWERDLGRVSSGSGP